MRATTSVVPMILSALGSHWWQVLAQSVLDHTGARVEGQIHVQASRDGPCRELLENAL